MDAYNWENLPVIQKGEGIRLQALHGEKMTVSQWLFDPHTDLPVHSHPHEQIVIPQEGRFELTVNGEARELVPGEVVVVPPDVPHSGRAITASRVIDVFSPVREDMKK